MHAGGVSTKKVTRSMMGCNSDRQRLDLQTELSTKNSPETLYLKLREKNVE